MSKSDENVAKVHTIMRSDQHLTSEIANETGISYALVNEMCAKSVPHTLMELRKVTAAELFECPTQEAKFLLKVVTGDESWICVDNPETKCQSSDRTSSHHPEEKSRP